ncbi:unnamed protein product [Schistosoma margrebowiei]|uniref:Uncharacterized protein n=1 Tax=Schistosoma margrebowiei TaxID=48269 RepID=A0A183LJ82_9TREM|nr:unnamed protein product [Schistosoma margrebowiei]
MVSIEIDVQNYLGIRLKYNYLQQTCVCICKHIRTCRIKKCSFTTLVELNNLSFSFNANVCMCTHTTTTTTTTTTTNNNNNNNNSNNNNNNSNGNNNYN